MLKRAFCSMLLAGAVAGSAFAYSVQEQSQPDQTQQQSDHQAGHRHGGWGHQDTGKRVQHLTKKLNLSSDQQSKIKGILDQQQTQFQSLHQDSSMSRQDRHAKMMDLRKSTDDQIRAVLNPDQQKTFDEMRQKQMERMRQHKEREQGSAPATQPPSSKQPQ